MTVVRVNKMLYGGAGLSETDTSQAGETISFVLPHEVVEILPGGELRILEPSPDRAAPKCLHFGICGGCHYQHATYAAQLAIKQSILKDTLTASGATDLPEVETHSSDAWHYRNRIRLRVGAVDGEVRIGYNRHSASGGDPVLPITMCPIAAPILWQMASALLDIAKNDPAVQPWLAAAVELELFTNHDETALQLTLFTRRPSLTSFPAFCAAMQQAVPQLIGAGVALLPKKPSPQGRRAEHPKPGPQWGAPGLSYKVGSDSHWVPRGGFFQVNRHLVSTLRDLATGNRTGTLAWDLYAGVGLFSRALAERFQQVVAVEAAEPAAAALKSILAAAPNGKAHRAFAATTLDFLQSAAVQRERPSLIVMDPPRAGIGPEVCALLARVRAPELVYVSCDPLTLARDLALLTGSGYKIAELHLVDMFPETFHMETIAILHLQSARIC